MSTSVEPDKMVALKLRSMIRAPKGYVLISCDLSQAETWVVAFEANEVNMQHSLMYGDIHTETAGNAIFNSNPVCSHSYKDQGEKLYKCLTCGMLVTEVQRYTGKRCNHAFSYGMSAEKGTQTINKESDKPPYLVVSLPQVREYHRLWHSYYQIKAWWEEIQYELSTQDRILRTTYGRERQFFAPWGDELFKEGYSYKPQSTVADHFNGATHPELGIAGGLREIYKQIAKPSGGTRRIVNQAHDSCMVLTPTGTEQETAEHMVSLLKRPLVIKGREFTIPVDCEMGERWGQLEKVKIAA
jgi:hypothetical protein